MEKEWFIGSKLRGCAWCYVLKRIIECLLHFWPTRKLAHRRSSMEIVRCEAIAYIPILFLPSGTSITNEVYESSLSVRRDRPFTNKWTPNVFILYSPWSRVHMSIHIRRIQHVYSLVILSPHSVFSSAVHLRATSNYLVSVTPDTAAFSTSPTSRSDVLVRVDISQEDSGSQSRFCARVFVRARIVGARPLLFTDAVSPMASRFFT